MNPGRTTISYDCRYYLGDRPCIWHKKEGVVCQCEHYSAPTKKIALIKLDAMGDVLRTTCLLPGLKAASPESWITWITRAESMPLIKNNPYVDEGIPYGPESLLTLSTRKFDQVINLDAGKISSALATLSKADEKTGFLMHERGYVYATNEAAEEWLGMGVFDNLKKANRRTYQDVMCSILAIPATGMRYVLRLTPEEEQAGDRHLEDLGVDLGKKIIGIHTGGGGRWTQKQWLEEKFIELIERMNREFGQEVVILLLGGPQEREQNRRILSKVNGSVVDAGCDNTARQVGALISCCSVVLSGDSLAMHLALAMGRRVVVLFGPTSHAEIELFGLGEKVFADLDCLVCYKQVCDCKPNCMELITIDMVKQAILRQLSLS